MVFHLGTSLVQKRMRSVPAEEVFAAVREAEKRHGRVKYGVFGDPDKAKAAFGRAHCEHTIEHFAKFIRELEGTRP